MNWVIGQDVLIAPDIPTDLALQHYPGGVRQVRTNASTNDDAERIFGWQRRRVTDACVLVFLRVSMQVALPSRRNYVRLTPDPGALEDDEEANNGEFASAVEEGILETTGEGGEEENDGQHQEDEGGGYS